MSQKRTTQSAEEIIARIRSFLGNPAVRVLIGRYRDFKRVHGALEVALEKREPHSIGERFDAALFKRILSHAAETFSASFDDIVDTFQDPWYVRGLATVITSIARFGVTLPQRLSAPFLVVWNVTKRCNLKCKHCYANASLLGAPDELSFEDKKRIIDMLDNAGTVAIAFSGGEPLMTPRILELLEYTARTGMQVSIATNGTLITPELAKRLKEVGVNYVEISIDSPNPEEHDEFRGVPGAWERAIQGIKYVKRAGITTGIAYVVTRKSVDHVPEMIDLARRIGVHTLMFFQFIPTGRGKQFRDLEMRPEDVERFLNYIYDAWEHGTKPQILSTNPVYARISVSKVEKGGKRITMAHFGAIPNGGRYGAAALALAEFVGGCGAGRAYFALEHNGDVYPCVFLPIRVGNILRDGFDKIWFESELFNAFRDRDSPRHAAHACPYKYVCGGCRAHAYAVTGDPLGPDPTCLYARQHGIWDTYMKARGR